MAPIPDPPAQPAPATERIELEKPAPQPEAVEPGTPPVPADQADSLEFATAKDRRAWRVAGFAAGALALAVAVFLLARPAGVPGGPGVEVVEPDAGSQIESAAGSLPAAAPSRQGSASLTPGGSTQAASRSAEPPPDAVPDSTPASDPASAAEAVAEPLSEALSPTAAAPALAPATGAATSPAPAPTVPKARPTAARPPKPTAAKPAPVKPAPKAAPSGEPGYIDY